VDRLGRVRRNVERGDGCGGEPTSRVPYHPMLIDAAYAGLMTEQWDQAVVIPTLNRDGDCLSDLVLAMFGSIAGAESVLLALDEQLQPTAAMAEAPHGTAPSLEGKNVANPMAMLLACAAVLEHAGIRGDTQCAEASRALRHATLTTAMDGIRCFDLAGSASTSEVVDEVVARMRNRESTGAAGHGRRPGHRAGLRLIRREGNDAM